MKFISYRSILGSGLLAVSLALPACVSRNTPEENKPQHSLSLEEDYKTVMERQFLGALESMRHSRWPGNEFTEVGGKFYDEIYAAGFDGDGNGPMDYILVARERTDGNRKTYFIAGISIKDPRFNGFNNELLK